MIKQIFTILLLLFSTLVFAQKHTISGYITDKQNGEKLIGANVYDSNTYQGVVSNTYGFFSLTLKEGPVKLKVSFVGYETQEFTIELLQNVALDVELKSSLELEEVTVVGEKAGINIESTQMSTIELPMKTIANIPAFMGEPDLIKTIQLLPGVQSGSEGMSGMYVRGGGPDQNLILLDGVPVYNVNHLFGFFSVFNNDAVRNVKLIKGGFPARYGGRLSSVLDISMKEGNAKEFHGSGSLGLIASKLTLEGPINDRSSFIISGRRTYIDILAYPVLKVVQKANGIEGLRAGYYFYDLNAKVNYKLSDKSRIYLSAYTGKDRFYSSEKDSYSDSYYNESTGNYVTQESKWENGAEIWWGNITSSLRWNYQYTSKLFSNTTLTYSRYKMLTGFSSSNTFNNETTSTEANYNSGIDDVGVRIDYDYYPLPEHHIRFGVGNTNHNFNPGIFVYKEDRLDSTNYETEAGNSRISSNELEAYIEDDFRIGSLIKINAGAHFTAYTVRNKSYYSFQPRVSSRFQITEKWSAKASFAQMDQYINLLTNANIGLPTDLWVPATDNVKPMRSRQFAVGTMYQLPKNFEFSMEGFYKEMNDLVGYIEGATYFSFENDWETKVESGKGLSYGIELLLMRTVGNTTGWIGYTLSKTENQFDGQNQGEPYPYNFDRRHDMSIVLSHKLNETADLGVTWVYGSGNPTTLGAQEYPTIYAQQNTIGNEYYHVDENVTDIEHKNNFRMPAYHRLDVSLSIHKEVKWGKRTWTVALYNAYNRRNPFYIQWGYDYDGLSSTQKLYKYSLFPIMPSIAYKFVF